MSSNKIPYAILALEIEKLYSKDIPEDNDKAIEEHCEYIAQVIRSMGWSEEEYMERWMKEQDIDLN
jgi:hypothetical protein